MIKYVTNIVVNKYLFLLLLSPRLKGMTLFKFDMFYQIVSKVVPIYLPLNSLNSYLTRPSAAINFKI